jgi:RHS repeat-associated protein
LRSLFVDEALVRNGTEHFIIDALGSTVGLADASGSLVSQYTYEPFGSATSSGASSDNPVQFAGRENDRNGLYFNRARYYSPALGRFLGEDPSGLNGGGPNVYAYVGNSPVNATDPSGKACVSRNGTTNCVAKDRDGNKIYDVSFPTPPDWTDFADTSLDYHFYCKAADAGRVPLSSLEDWLRRNPTPAPSQSPATPSGTPNDATPWIGGRFSSSGLSPVLSFWVTNQVTGRKAVVNVTRSGHRLAPGIVVREVSPTLFGTTAIASCGEGTGWLQAPGSWTADILNSVWESHVP